MPVFGHYHSLTEVHWSNDSTIFSAVTETGPRGRKFAIKVRRFPDTELNAAAFEAASIQKNACESGGKHLVPVFETGITDAGCAWYVTQLFDSSLLEFLKARNAATPALLYRIVDDILAGLEEFWRVHHRPHGNLKPSNILFEGSDARNLQARLADPAPLPEETNSAGDLFKLGEAIYRLVRRSPRAVTINPPLERTEEWDEFGDAWLNFTNRLLNHRANEAHDALAVTRSHLRTLRKAPVESAAARKRPIGLWKIAAAIVLLAGGAAGAKFFIDRSRTSDETRKDEMTAEERQRALEALAICQNPPSELTADTYLMEVFGKLKNANPDKLLLNALSAAAKPEVWPSKHTLDEASRTYQEREWTGLWKAILGTHGDVDIGKPLEPQLAATLKNASLVDTINGEWQLAKRLFDQWAETPDSELLPLKDWADEQMKVQTDLQSAAQEVPVICSQLEVANRRASSDDWKSQFCRRRFRAESPAARRLKSPGDWFSETEKFKRPDRSDLTQWQKKTAGLQTVMASLPAAEREHAQSDLNEINRRLEDPVKSDSDFLNATFVKLGQLLKPSAIPTPSPTLGNNPLPPLATPPPGPPHTPEEMARIKWLHDLLSLATPKTSAKDFVTIFDSLSANSAIGHPELQNQLKALIKPKPIPPPALGADWTLVAADPGARPYYIYKYKGTPYFVPFVLIQPTNGQPSFYMAGIELPLGLAQAANQLPASNPLDGNGPQAWPVPRAGWQWKQGTIGNLNNTIGGPVTFYASEGGRELDATQIEKITTATPLTAITGKQARDLASSLQCELPTFEQWQAAKAYASTSTVVHPRLRGALWKRQFDHWKDLRSRFIAKGNADPGGSIPWPDDGSYTFKRGNWEAGATPAIYDPADNSPLWFRSVYPGVQQYNVIYDWEGNAAQFLYDKDRFSVVGGSAISDPAVRDTPQEVQGANAARAFSDVGVRLVAKMAAATQEDELLAFRNLAQQELARLENPAAIH